MTNGNDSMTIDQMTIPSPLGSHHLFADVCVGLLEHGQGVRFKANGCSMYPTICDGEIINVEPVPPTQVRHGDIILYRGPRGITAHRVIHIQREVNSIVGTHGPSFLLTTRGDSLMADDFPVVSDQILGKVFSVERNGRAVALYGTRAIILQEMRLFLFTLKRCVVCGLSRIKELFLL
jgi:signal peptidase I